MCDVVGYSVQDSELESLKGKLQDAELSARQAKAALLSAQSPNSEAGDLSIEARIQEGQLQVRGQVCVVTRIGYLTCTSSTSLQESSDDDDDDDEDDGAMV